MIVADSPSKVTAGVTPRPLVRSAAWGALALGLIYAAVSAYWALGGTVGLTIFGGRLVATARSLGPLAQVGLWVVVVLKIIGGALGVVLLGAPSRAWRRLVLVGTWILRACSCCTEGCSSLGRSSSWPA